MRPKLELRGLGKTFDTTDGPLRVFGGIDLAIERNAFVAVVGASGCGKSTLLGIVGGLVEPTEGAALVDGREVTRPGRDLGFVFQSYSLFGWMTVERNIAFALEKSALSPAERAELTRELIREVGLAGFENALPKTLSGGMRQRVAIARTLACRPSVLLMDEPFGALDAQTRAMMQEMLLEIWETHRTTVLFVTHDVDEALFLADRVVVLASRPGRIKTDLAVELPRPRPFEIVTSPEFAALKRAVLADIREETLKVMQAARAGG